MNVILKESYLGESICFFSVSAIPQKMFEISLSIKLKTNL